MIFPEFTNLPHRPHDYQRDAFLSHAKEAYEGEGRGQLIVMATGLGKSVTACLIARHEIEHRGGRVLILAHMDNLIDQLVEEFAYWGCPCVVEKGERRGLDMVKIRTPGSACVVGSVATMKGKRLAQWPADYFTLIITDEAHRAPGGESYRNIYRRFPGAKLLGLTATPTRTDKRNLGEIFPVKAYEYLLPLAIKQRDLSPLKLYQVSTSVDLRDIKVVTRDGVKDFDPDAVADRIGPEIVHLAKQVVFGNEEFPGGYLGPGQTLIFAPCRLSAQAFASAFTELGVPCAAVDYKTADRAEIIRGFKEGTWTQAGRYAALANLGLLGVGFNHRPIGNIVLCRPTQSMLLLEQIIGRGTRLCEGKLECRIIDFTWIVDADSIARPVDLFLPPGAEPFVRDAARKAAESPDSDPVAAVAEAQRKAEEEAEKKRKRDEAAKKQRERQVQVKVDDRAPVRHRSRSFDLFAVRELSRLRAPEVHGDTLRMPVTPSDAAKLRELGFDSTDGMSQREADREMAYWTERKEVGMSSLKQIKLLVRSGVDPDHARTLTRSEAQQLIGPMLARFQQRSG